MSYAGGMFYVGTVFLQVCSRGHPRIPSSLTSYTPSGAGFGMFDGSFCCMDNAQSKAAILAILHNTRTSPQRISNTVFELAI